MAEQDIFYRVWAVAMYLPYSASRHHCIVAGLA